MQSKISIVALATLMLASATPALAQTNGYVREKPLLGQASTSLGGDASIRVRAEGGGGGTSTPLRARAEGGVGLNASTTVGGKGILRASSTASMRLKAYASSTPEKARERVLEKRAKIESIIAAKKLVITNEMFTRIKEKVGQVAANMNATVTRLTETSAAIRTRANELAGKGVDASATLSILAEADARLVTLKASITDLSEDAELAAASSTPGKAWGEAREAFKISMQEAHAIRDLLHDAVAALKTAVRESQDSNKGVSGAVSAELSTDRGNVNATTTATTTVATTTAQ